MRGRDAQRTTAIEEQAIRHLLALLDDDTPTARAALDTWIALDPAHGVAFARAEAAWDHAALLKGTGTAEPAVAWTPPAPPLVTGRIDRRRLLAAGAMLAVAAGASAALIHQRGLYETGVGETRDVRLEDGSVLHLNTRSRVRVAYGAERRLVSLLAGEAYFDVAHDAARPFDVEARGATVRAIGTAFNVRMRDSVVELTVTKGLVGVSEAGQPIRKVPASKGAVIRPHAVELALLDHRLLSQRTAWRDRMIELDGQSVDQAVEEFNRYRKAPIVIGDERLSPERVGGRFRTDESSEFIAALTATLPARAIANADGSVLLLYQGGE